MTRKWRMEIKAANDKSNACEIQLSICDPATHMVVEAVPVCSSVDQFKARIADLKDELDQLLLSVETKCRELTATAIQPESDRMNAEAIWKKMEGCGSKEEMFDYFNSFDVALRQETADHIFMQASMFRGWGPVFAEHYNLATRLLET